MSTAEDTVRQDRVVRIWVSPDEWKALRKLAIENEQDIKTLVTTALQTSPLTEKAFA